MTGHVIRITDNTIELLHPDSCDKHRLCAEGQLERKTGLSRWERKGNGDWPVMYFAEFRDGEYSEDLVRDDYADLDHDFYAVLDADPTPDDRRPVRGFPYSGGRWSA